MPAYRLQVAWGADTTFPRDVLTINPVFDIRGPGTPNPDQLCEDLATALSSWAIPTGAREVHVKAYDVRGTPPVFPVGDAIRNTGQAPASPGPREVALCLSFFSSRNLPRQRGRLYVPMACVSSAAPTGARPSGLMRQKVADLVPIFTGLGGIDVDWSIHSRTTGELLPVTDWWVDDEWDVVRSRGMRPTTRLTGTTTEATGP